MINDASEKSVPNKKRKKTWKKFRNIFLLLLVLFLAGFISIRYYYPFGEGVKSGQLNYVVYKGLVFKTYEGKLIQTGFRSQTGNIQSNEFEFSIENKEVAERLMRAGGKTVELHYKEFFGALPWRGYSRYVVDSIVSINEQDLDQWEDSLPPAEVFN